MSIGTLRCVAINVTDFALAHRFWSAVTGYEVLGPENGWHDWLGFLGRTEPRQHEMILIKCDAAPIQTEAPSHRQTNPVHIDITPTDGVDAAIDQIIELGGSVKKPASLYPRPGSYGNEPPVIDWASCRTRSATSSASCTTSAPNSPPRRCRPPDTESPATTISALQHDRPGPRKNHPD
jgi:Glyoxalase-like domain